MGKLKRVALIFLIILIQSSLAVTAGIVAMSFVNRDSLPPSSHIMDLNIGNLKKIDARKKIDEHFKKVLAKESLSISIEDGEYKIPFSEFDAKIDAVATLNGIGDWKNLSYMKGFINANFSDTKFSITPVFTFDEGKLRQKLIELSDKINKLPVDAAILIKDGNLVKKVESSGYSLNVANVAQTIRKQMNINFEMPLKFYKKDNFEVQIVNPDKKLKDYEDINLIISEYSTDILDIELLDSIKTGAEAINGIILDSKSNSKSEVFSFIDRLKNTDTKFQNDNEGYDQVASTLYAAILKAGIEKDAITRLPHKLAPDYIEPGLDAWISGSGGDLRFSNTFDNKIALFAVIEDNKLVVRIAGNQKDLKKAVDIKSETVQKFDPPVVNIENNDLKQGEKLILNPGKEGVLIKVYRNDELISTDRYDAEKAIVQVGPGADWNSETVK